MIVLLIAFAVSGVVSIVAVVKHGSVSAALASAKREAVLIENEAVRLEGVAKTAILAAVTRLKAL